MENFKHKKSLGQNFLKDDNVLNNIVKNIDAKENDLIIEIGCGHGALTKKLQSFNSYLIGYEIDERTKNVLLPLQDEKTKIIYNDILNVDLTEDLKNIKYNNLYVVANLPYYITTPIIEKLIESKLDIKEMYLMVQKEVAERFSAKPNSKKYGSITIYFNYYFEVTKVFDVKRTCFEPIPNVDSSIIKFKKHHNKYDVKDENVFFKLIKDSFKQKRKTIRNNLLEYNLELIEKILIKNDLNLQSRAENISIEVFIEIANVLSSNF